MRSLCGSTPFSVYGFGHIHSNAKCQFLNRPVSSNDCELSSHLRVDSGGPGEWRGGLGQHYRLVNTTPNPLHVIGLGRRNEFPALGLKGGKSGAARVYRLEGKEVFPRGRYTLQPGEAIEVLDAGGGGYGDPWRRNPDAVRADLANGFISAEAAKRDYGVKE